MRTISLCITTYNRFDFLFESFRNVLQDERISEIIIVDDASDMQMFDKIFSFCKDIPKIELYRNATNQGCYQNKMIALSYATNPFGIIFDSDNIMNPIYIDALFSIPEWDKHTIYAPDFAAPHFNYTHFGGQTITKENVHTYNGQKMFETLINTMNYFVNVSEYLRVFDREYKEPYAADSIIQNYNWFKAGNKMHIVPAMQYIHRVHPGSHFAEHQHKSIHLAKIFEDKLKELR